MSTAARKTLILHIGDHKTGSTSIQTAFAKDQVRLEGHTLFYPAKLASNVLREQCRDYGKATTQQEREKAAEPLGKLAARVRKSDADFVLISAEALEQLPAALLRRIVDEIFSDTADDIRIVSYVRPHPGRIISSFGECTKIGIPRVMSSSLEQFSHHRKKDSKNFYLPRFSALRKQFGDRFLLRPMIRNQLYRASVVDDFVHHAFGGIPFHIENADTQNESLFLENLMRLKVLQQHMIDKPAKLRHRLGWEFARVVAHMPPPPTRTKLQLHKSLAEDIRGTYLDDARAMDRTFFDGAPLLETELHGAVDKALAEPQSTDPADHLSESEMRSLELMSRMIAGLLEAEEVNWPAFLHDRRIADIHRTRKPARAAG